MSRNLKKLVALICAVLLCIGTLAGFAVADDEETTPVSDIVLTPQRTVELSGDTYETGEGEHSSFVTLAASLALVEFATEREAEAESAAIRIPESVPEDASDDVTVLSYTEIPVYIDGESAGTAMKIGDVTCVPVTGFFEAVGFDVEAQWDQDTGVAVYNGDGLELTVYAYEKYLVANDRCFYGEYICNVNGSLIAPVRELARCLGLEVEWDETNWTVNIKGEPLPLESGSTYYNQEDLYWLSRIIFAESGNQPLEGMIGVGNVVLNRVEDPTCPDTVYDVIFDDEYGVQFSVTETGTIFLEPSELAVRAAKMCLEGCNLVGDSLFFVNPTIGASNWFASTRTFVASIGDHDFYA